MYNISNFYSSYIANDYDSRKKNKFKGIYSLSPLYCGLIFTVVHLFIMHLSWGNFLVSLFLGMLYFYILIPSCIKNRNKYHINNLFFKTLGYLATLFLVSMTFTIYGKFYVDDSKFDIYTQNGHQYVLLRVYGENVFMREVKNGNMMNEITYFNAQNLTGMKLIINPGQ